MPGFAFLVILLFLALRYLWELFFLGFLSKSKSGVQLALPLCFPTLSRILKLGFLDLLLSLEPPLGKPRSFDVLGFVDFVRLTLLPQWLNYVKLFKLFWWAF